MNAPDDPASEKWQYAPPLEDVKIIYKDDDLLGVNKPSGLLSVPGREHADCLLARVQAEAPDALLVHRLDMDTSGVMIFARNKAAQRHLGLQFERRHLRKKYIALVKGHPDQASGTVDLPLVVDWSNRPLQKICHTTGRSAQTKWVVQERYGSSTRMALHPITGRSHQLRVHMRAIGHPILGDRFYAPPLVANETERLCLHANVLSLRHPHGGDWLDITAPLPF